MGWKTERFGDVCTFVRGPFGGSLKKNIFKEDGYAVYEQQHAIYDQFTDIRYFVDEEKFSEMSRFELFSGDLIMSCSGTMGKIAIVPPSIPRGIINQALLKLTPKNDLSPKFLKLWMESRNFQEQIESLSQGAAIKNMASVKILKEIRVPTPPIDEQKHIVTTLDQVFADIEKARATAETNLKNARELFDSYMQQVFRQRGEGWVEKKFSECFKLKSGDGLTAKNMVEGPYPVYGGNGIAGTHKDFNLSDESIIIGRVGALCGNARYISEKIWLTDNAFKINDYSFEFDLAFLTYLLNFKKLRSFARQAAQPVISNSSLKDLILHFPKCTRIQNKLAIDIQKIELKVNELEQIYTQKIKVLDELKKSILQKAFSGELTKSKGIAA